MRGEYGNSQMYLNEFAVFGRLYNLYNLYIYNIISC